MVTHSDLVHVQAVHGRKSHCLMHANHELVPSRGSWRLIQAVHAVQHVLSLTAHHCAHHLRAILSFICEPVKATARVMHTKQEHSCSAW
eukprot:1143481-Pelagomonas_calceolata.AAC.3